MTSSTSDYSEPSHRKQKGSRRKKKRKSPFRKPRPEYLTPGCSDLYLKTSLLELELKVLELDYNLAKFYEEREKSESKGECSESESSESSEEEVEDEAHNRWARSMAPAISNSLPDTENTKVNNKFEIEDFNLMVVNPGGLNGKRESICNAIHKFDIRAVIVSETHSVGKQIPELDQTMKAFFMNRSSKKNKGGVCIFLEKSLAEHAVVIGKSRSDHEWIAVKINYFEKPVVIIALYGCQTSKNTAGEMRQKWDELWDFASTYRKDHITYICGDFNAAVGTKFNMKNNCESTNKNGRLLMKGVVDGGWMILNSLFPGDKRTHVDRSSDSRRCLDYIVTNYPQSCTRVYIDNDYSITPYKVTGVTPNTHQGDKVYTDHKAILVTLKVKKHEEKSCKALPPIVVKNEEGDIKFHMYTEELAEDMIELWNSGEDILGIFKITMRKLAECERLSYLRITKTRIKRKMWTDREIFLRLTSDLEKAAAKVSNFKTSDKIFKMRGDKKVRERNEEVFSMYNSEGELVEDRESVLSILTEYNRDLLGRNQHRAEFKEIFEKKREIVKMLDETQIVDFNTLTPREYVRAIHKVTRKGKKMFSQFLKCSNKLLALFFFIFKRLYEEEIIPDMFIETVLVHLFKKNDPRLPSNYRFLHMKRDVSRLFELLVYMKLENHFDTFTNESQMGGRRGGDTTEHLAMITSLVKDKEEKGEAIILTAIDAQKCFDVSHLSDNHACLQMEGADKKALKVMHKYQHNNKLRVKGSDEVFEIENGVGQGGVQAARIVTSALTEATTRHMMKMPEDLNLYHRELKINDQGYVDDEMLISDNTKSSAACTALYTLTMDELAMKAHPEKSVQIVSGAKEAREKIIEELRVNPNILQKFPLKTKTSEKYLGFWLVQGSYDDMINKNIKVKQGLLQGVACEIRSLCDLPQIKRFGKCHAQKLMAVSQAVPVALYGTQAWIDIKPEQYKAMEDAFKGALATILSVPKTTNYEAMLKACNLIHLEQFLDCVKLRVWNTKIHKKASGRIVRLILHETVMGIKSGLAGDLERLCHKYQIHNICLEELDPDTISDACKKASYVKQWRAHLSLKGAPMMPWANKMTYLWYELPYNLARGMMMKEMGLLITKSSAPHMMLRRHMISKEDRSCLWSHLGCSGRDDYDHLVSGDCDYYVTKMRQTGDIVRSEAEFIHFMNLERCREFSQPLVMFGCGEEQLADEILDDLCVTADNTQADKTISEIAARADPLNITGINLTMDKVTTTNPLRLETQALKSLSNGDMSISALENCPEPKHKFWANQKMSSLRLIVIGTSRVILGRGGKGTQTPPTWTSFLASLCQASEMPGARLRSQKQYVVTPPLDLSVKQVGTGVEAHVNDCVIPIRMHGTATRITKSKLGKVEMERTDEVERRHLMDTTKEKIVSLSVTRTFRFSDEVTVVLSKKKSRKRNMTTDPGAVETDNLPSGSKVQEKFDEKEGDEYDGDHSELEFAEVAKAQTDTIVMAPTDTDNKESGDLGEPSKGATAQKRKIRRN